MPKTSRGDILCDYTLNAHFTIQNPGRFEGEPFHLPYFYDALMDGDGEVCGAATLLTIDDHERAAFPETLSPEDVAILIWVSDSGFVNSRLYQSMTEAERDLATFNDTADEDN